MVLKVFGAVEEDSSTPVVLDQPQSCPRKIRPGHPYGDDVLARAAHEPYIGLASADHSVREVALVGLERASAALVRDEWVGLAWAAFAADATEDSVHPRH